MDKTKLQNLLTVSIFLFLLPCVHSVTVECLTYSAYGQTCLVSIGSNTADITRISEERPGTVCIGGTNYGYVYYTDQMSYLWVHHKCGGTFRVTAPSTGSPQWSRWSAWYACSTSCGQGSQTRTRTCPTGRNTDCSTGVTDNSSTRTCLIANCPLASWNPWGSWGSCSVTCGTGIQSRIRTCSTNNNSDCPTNLVANLQNRVCTAQACSPTTGTGPTNNAGCGRAGSSFGYRIIGGTGAGNCQFPWMAMVFNSQKGTSCGGSIIDSTHIMTAAHCVVVESEFEPGQYTVTPPRYISVYTGASTMPFRQPANYIQGLVRRRASAVKVHELYSSFLVDNDIAIITLSEPIIFDQCHVPICLPTSQQTASTATRCLVMGWGTTSNVLPRVSSELLYTGVKVIDKNTCSRMYRSFNTITELCVDGEGTGSCTGDSGGPLSCRSTDGRYYQYGVVSSGARNRCGNLASVYTSVTSFLPWIAANTA